MNTSDHIILKVVHLNILLQVVQGIEQELPALNQDSCLILPYTSDTHFSSERPLSSNFLLMLKYIAISRDWVYHVSSVRYHHFSKINALFELAPFHVLVNCNPDQAKFSILFDSVYSRWLNDPNRYCGSFSGFVDTSVNRFDVVDVNGYPTH